MKTTATEWTDTDDQIVEKYLGKKAESSFEGLVTWAEWGKEEEEIVRKYQATERVGR